MSLSRKLFVLLLAIISFSLNAQNKRVVFQKLTIDDGLPHKIINCIAQDKAGFLWIGTHNGLVRFDGVNIKIFRNNKYDSSSIQSNSIRAFYYYKEKNLLFIGTGTGLTRFDPVTETFFNYKNNPDDPLHILNDIIFIILPDSKNRLWLEYSGFRKQIFDINTEKVIHSFDLADKNPVKRYIASALFRSFEDGYVFWGRVLKTNSLIAIDIDDERLIIEQINANSLDSDYPINPNTILYDTHGGRYVAGGSLYYQTQEELHSNNWKKIEIFEDNLSSISQDYEITELREDKYNNIWIATATKGLVIYNPNSGQIDRYHNTSASNGKLSFNGISEIIFDFRGNDWVINNEGIAFYDRLNKSFDQFVHNDSDSWSLSKILSKPFSGRKMYTIDSLGIYWVIGEGSINYFSFQKSKFNLINKESGIINNKIWGITSDSKGYLWLGGENGLNKIDITKSTIQQFKPNDYPEFISLRNVASIIEIKPDNFFIGGPRVEWISFEDNELKKVMHLQPNMENSDLSIQSWGIFTLMKDHENCIWIGQANGVSRYTLPSERYPEGIVDNYLYSDKLTVKTVRPGAVWHIFEDSKNVIWFATASGLSSLNVGRNYFTHYEGSVEDKESFYANGVTSISEDETGDLWITTEGNGLFRYNYNENKFQQFSVEDNNLPTNGLLSGYFGSESDLWISSDKGLIKFDTKTHKVQSFDIKDGLQGNEFTAGAHYKDENTGIIYVGGLGGLTYFHPDSISQASNSPQINFTSLKINSKEVKPNEMINNRVIITKSIVNTNRIELSHKENIFSISFAAVDYANPSVIKYRYVLDGFSTDTIRVDSKNAYASYTNLSPGKYIFKVLSTNSDGVIMNNTKELYIRIRPPWWKTWWFYVLLVISCAAIVVMYIKMREEQLRSDKLILENQLSEGEKQINKSKIEVENQAEELRQRNIAEKEQRFFNEGMVRFGQILSENTSDIKTLCKDVIVEIVKYLKVQQGAIYILNENDPKNLYIELVYAYALNHEQLETQKYLIGEGMPGTCFKTADIIELKELIDNESTLSSGLGEGAIKYKIFLPVIQHEVKVGVIELGGFSELEAYEVQFLETLAHNFASNIHVKISSVKVNEMLIKSNKQSEELKLQEDELKQNLEEVAFMQEETSRQITELQDNIDSLEKENKKLRSKK